MVSRSGIRSAPATSRRLVSSARRTRVHDRRHRQCTLGRAGESVVRAKTLPRTERDRQTPEGRRLGRAGAMDNDRGGRRRRAVHERRLGRNAPDVLRGHQPESVAAVGPRRHQDARRSRAARRRCTAGNKRARCRRSVARRGDDERADGSIGVVATVPRCAVFALGQPGTPAGDHRHLWRHGLSREPAAARDRHPARTWARKARRSSAPHSGRGCVLRAPVSQSVFSAHSP